MRKGPCHRQENDNEIGQEIKNDSKMNGLQGFMLECDEVPVRELMTSPSPGPSYEVLPGRLCRGRM